MNTNAKWYIIQVVPNHESIVKENLENKAFDEEDTGIEQVLLPYSSSLTKAGTLKKKVMFPGYLFLKISMSDNVWYIIRNTQYVTGIVGSSGHRTKPTPMQEHEIENIISKMKTQTEILTSGNVKDIQIKIDFKIGDVVTILKGNFEGQSGVVQEIIPEKGNVIVEIEFFGRMSPVTLPINEVVKK